MSYNWPDFPSYGDNNYYTLGKTALDTWVANLRDMTPDGVLSIGPSGLLALNQPTDSYVPVYNQAAGKFEWQDITGVVGGDTYQVKRNAADSPGYLDDKVTVRVMELPDVTSERIIGSASGFDLQAGLYAYINSGLSCSGKTIADGTYVLYANSSTKYFYLVQDTGVTTLATPAINGYYGYQGIAVIGNYLYRAVGDSSASYVVKIERYDPVTNTWTTFTPSGAGPNYDFRGAFEYDGLLWLAGKTKAYDPSTNSWIDKSATNSNIINFKYIGYYVTEENNKIFSNVRPYTNNDGVPKSYDPATDTVTDLTVPSSMTLTEAFYLDGIIYGIQKSDKEWLVAIDTATDNFVRQNMPFEMSTKGLFPVNNDHIHLHTWIYPNLSHLKKVLVEA